MPLTRLANAAETSDADIAVLAVSVNPPMVTLSPDASGLKVTVDTVAVAVAPVVFATLGAVFVTPSTFVDVIASDAELDDSSKSVTFPVEVDVKTS